MEIKDAKTLAESYLESKLSPPPNGDKLVIVSEGIEEGDDGWFFPYQALKYVQTRDLQHSIVGNWPIFVSKDGRVGLRRFGAPFKPDL